MGVRPGSPPIIVKVRRIGDPPPGFRRLRSSSSRGGESWDLALRRSERPSHDRRREWTQPFSIAFHRPVDLIITEHVNEVNTHLTLYDAWGNKPYRARLRCTASPARSSGGQRGRRNSPLPRPRSFNAHLTGIGFGARDKRSRQSGNNRA